MNTEGSGHERQAGTLEENLKKAVTELLVVKLFSERPRYIGELVEEIRARSDGMLTVVFPYAAFYRIYHAGLIEEAKKQPGPDGRLRQYYKITELGRTYLEQHLQTYDLFLLAVSKILNNNGGAEQ